MQSTASLAVDQFSDVLSRLPADLDLEDLAWRTKAIERKRKLESGANLLRRIIQRKSAQASEAARKRLLSTASSKQKALDPRRLLAAEFMILATSLPPEGYRAEEILAVYRLRWQVELAFKRLKSLLRIAKLPTYTEDASRSWLYAHLIMALLCDDLSQDCLDAFP